MRYAQGHREETRRRIVETASRLFQEKGVDAVGVDEIMRACGLTHGGFYGHFRAKEELVAEACAFAVEQQVETWSCRARDLAPEAAFDAFVTEYLDPDGAECPLGMLGGEVARRGEDVRQAYTEKVRQLVDFMARELGCGRDEALLAFAAIVGASTVARASDDEAFAAEILATTRRELLRLSAERCAPAPQRRVARR